MEQHILKVVDLQPNVFYMVNQWTLKKSKYGDRLLIKDTMVGTDVVVQFWSNALLFNELICISDKKVNFAPLLGIRYTFKVIGESSFNGYKTVQLETCLHQ